MSETKDPAIKLFGKTIPLQEIAAGFGFDGSVCGDGENECDPCSAHDDDNDDDENDELEVVDKDTLADRAVHKGAARANENPITPSIDNESATLKSSRTEDEQSDTGVSEEKTLKKPDKIIPCPRCNSMDTKFCYYNNYNVNQPRHFCKNCQRYWTAGGTMRNVPVGAGRRKNKNLTSQYRHIAGSENLPNSQPNNIPNGIHQPALKQNGSVLTFCSDSPLCESMASVMSLTEKNIINNTRNGFHKPEELKIPVSYEGSENGVDKLSGSSISVSNFNDIQESPPSMQNFQGYPHQIPCFPGAPWPYPWNLAQWNPSFPPPGYCPPGYPMPFYPPATYWGWNVPLMPHPSAANHQYLNTGPISPLGKHSREDEDELVQPNNSDPEEEPSKQSTTSEKCLWIPKTLRIDDLGEAAKSSIWDTLGIKNEMVDPIGGRGLFKAFRSKKPENSHIADTSSVLQANPAALSRSLNFQEST